jgi:glycosyltransferase involved in cell wall biosynthesis
MPKVLIVQSEMKHYRLAFFEGLYEALQQDGIESRVVYSNSNILQAQRKDGVDLQPPVGKRIPGRWFFGRFIYQNIWKEVFQSDLVIVGSEVKFIVNPLLMIMSGLGLKKVAFWGLGPNRHPDRSPITEWFKQHFFTCVDWWFAYTESIADYLKLKGMPADKITNVQNATDTAELKQLISNIPEDEVESAKINLTGTASSRIGLYCGFIGAIKELPFLLEAARSVKKKCQEFHLVIVGDGPDRIWLQNEITHEPWIHYVGFKNHEQGAIYYKMADVFLLGGTVGLAVVDSFAAGLPLVATLLNTHPPEISYVKDGLNGLLVAHDAQVFANSVLNVLSDPILMERLRRGACESGNRYTMEAMVENYRSGIHKCLAMRKSVSSSRSSASFPRTAND